MGAGEFPGGGSSSFWGSGSVPRAGGSSASSGMSIKKPYYVHSTAGGREMSETRPGWRLRKPDGSYKTGWLIREGKRYYLDAAGGSMKTGWVLLEGKWYFLSPDGMLVTNGYTVFSLVDFSSRLYA
ncbi:hypothetical protein D3Z51_08800 [Clostridiaceae bacterium]|nr:hypothetical protein [Clostridiaceae bacterium]RKI14361.1 hypothetical protein D7V81_08285 [bacterium 1XD21-70]